jgi:antitoxin ParD1/3/4
MPKNTSVTLGEHFDRFVAIQVESGRYGSASEVLRAGLRLLEDDELKRRHLRRLLEQGEASGVADYSLDSFLADLDEQESPD